MTAGPVERQMNAAALMLGSAGMSLGQWYGRGGWESLPWPARRAAAERALSDLNVVARDLAAAQALLIAEIDTAVEERLAADESCCSAQWGVCPDHGNTLTSSGARSWCRRPGCDRTWTASRVGQHCNEPAAGLVADRDGATVRLCAGHWADARERLVGATFLRRLPASGAR
jgi:hypothetical protein